MYNPDFMLHPQLAKDCFEVCDLPLSKILLMNDQQFPWFIQVPRVNDISEIIELSEMQQTQLWYESRCLSEIMLSHCQADKLNVAALGNLVPQLHIHHIARFRDDKAWPKPVWGACPPQAYESAQRAPLIAAFQHKLKEKLC